MQHMQCSGLLPSAESHLTSLHTIGACHSHHEGMFAKSVSRGDGPPLWPLLVVFVCFHHFQPVLSEHRACFLPQFLVTHCPEAGGGCEQSGSIGSGMRMG